MKTIKPSRLSPGDRVGLISPSNSVVENKDALDRAIDFLERELKIRIEIAPHAMGRHFYSSGTVVERLDDFHQMIADPTIKAVWFTTGGNTAIDLVEGLDYDLISENPKIISGISDATTLLDAITARTGLITFLGLEFLDFGRFEMTYELEHMRKAWFGNEPRVITPNPAWKNFDELPTSYRGWQTLKPGKITGRLVGGNFPSFYQLIGTPYSMDFHDSILVIESYKFKKRGIHQALMQLKLHGVFDHIAGILLGYCLGSDNPNEYGDKRPMRDLVLEVTQGYDFPVMWVGEIGHKVENIMLPIGAKATMDATHLTLSIAESVTV